MTARDALPAPFDPGPALTILHAEALRETLLARLAEPVDGDAPLVVDLSQVTAIDTAGVQLLLSLRRSLAERGRPWRLAAASTVARDVLTFYGLQALLEEAAA